jgi:hypothetical protein
MSSVGLLFVGAVLFINGLLFLGKVDAKSAGVFNLFVGVLQSAIPFYLIATAKTPDDILNAAGIFLFGFTYLYVGIGNLAGFRPEGLGWYSLWVAFLATGFGLTTILRFHDTPTGLLWLQWAVLWGVFWVVLALGVERLTTLAGWLTLILSVTTCTIPGFLSLLGTWSKVPSWAVLISIGGVALVLAPLARSAAGAPAQAGDEPRIAAGDVGIPLTG